jgi:hypothetical protein
MQNLSDQKTPEGYPSTSFYEKIIVKWYVGIPVWNPKYLP